MCNIKLESLFISSYESTALEISFLLFHGALWCTQYVGNLQEDKDANEFLAKDVRTLRGGIREGEKQIYDRLDDDDDGNE